MDKMATGKTLALVLVGLVCGVAADSFEEQWRQLRDNSAVSLYGAFNSLDVWLNNELESSELKDNLDAVAFRLEVPFNNTQEDIVLQRAMKLFVSLAKFKSCNEVTMEAIGDAYRGILRLHGRRRIDYLVTMVLRNLASECSGYIDARFNRLMKVWNNKEISLDMFAKPADKTDYETFLTYLDKQRCTSSRADLVNLILECAKDDAFVTIYKSNQLDNGHTEQVPNLEDIVQVFNEYLAGPCNEYKNTMGSFFDLVQIIKKLVASNEAERKNFLKQRSEEFRDHLHRYIMCTWVNTIDEDQLDLAFRKPAAAQPTISQS